MFEIIRARSVDIEKIDESAGSSSDVEAGITTSIPLGTQAGNNLVASFSPSPPPVSQSSAMDAGTEALELADRAKARGAIFTRREVVDFILDLVGYTADKPLCRRRLLEPSFGAGDFLLPAIERLLTAWNQSSKERNPLSGLARSIRAVELHRETFARTKKSVISLLRKHGLNSKDATVLADRWLVPGDFLLASFPDGFDTIVGNPPYVRQELIPDALLAEYRLRFKTIYDRADLYVPFLERSLLSLTHGGQLGFICADRWMKNRYGGPLRQLVADHFHLKVFVDMVDTQAFESEVIAYPAVTVISREKAGATRIGYRPVVERLALRRLSTALCAKRVPDKESGARELSGVTNGAEPWFLGSEDQRRLVRRIEASFPTIEDAGCKIGIGVATGADRVFIAPFDDLDVEPDRKVPLVMTRDILDGTVEWRGFGVINPFADAGGLVNLSEYPRLNKYLNRYKVELVRRHCASKAPQHWYRTIDRITPSLAKTEKLLVPDIKGGAHIVYENGSLYPHHNLYYITSHEWALKALQAVLLSGIAKVFVSTYSTAMRGGYLRFQAQYLRRIRLPEWKSVSREMRRALVKAAEARNLLACNQAAFDLYGLTKNERATIGGNGD